ncbi:MAG: hypothetical protein U9N83_14770 [Thermodesulfobacteriota bacterium]|nr:hypothetical protein [Thermodesulfobacteriota bacterium]
MTKSTWRPAPALPVVLLSQQGLKVMQIKGIKQTAVEFCRRSLVIKEFGHG